MKKLVLLLTLIISACADTSQITIPAETKNNVKINEACMDIQRFRVFQVLENDYALASACTSKWDTSFCIGTTVLLMPQQNIEYYDDMYVSPPVGQCAVQNGVYKYETRLLDLKTVPVIRFE